MSEMWTRVFAILPLLAAAAWAHPMGNFSVSHYTLIRPGAKAVEVTYALDIAELPTVMLMQDWKLDAASPKAELEAKASEQAREWMDHLTFTAGGKALTPRFERAELVITDGAGGLKVMRITSHLRLPAAPGTLDFEDHNYEGRAG
jgi:nickel/cobalt transporter (NicO) family protein